MRFRDLIYILTAIWLIQLTVRPSESAVIYVSSAGDDANSGTAEKPYRTIQHAVDRLQPGDTCYIRSGRYTETVVLNQINGTPDTPIRILGHPNERVILDGTKLVTDPWQVHGGHIYRTRLEQDIWQLFVDDVAMTPARWPNAHLFDGTAWDMKATWRHMSPKSEFGKAIDERPFAEMTRRRGEKTYVPLSGGINVEPLASSGLNATGAIAIMNLGSWLTWAQRVDTHNTGSDTFTYSTDFSGSGRAMSRSAERFPGNGDFWFRKNVRDEQAHYYLEGKLELLDSPGEWFYDPISGTLYLWTLDGGDPAEFAIRGKTETYVLSARESSYVHIQNIDFFGATFDFLDCKNMKIEDCHFRYPSQSKQMLGDFRRADVTSVMSSVRGGDRLPEKSSSNLILNCVFEHIDGPGFEIAGMNDRVENCLFAFVDNTCLGTGGGGSLNAGNSHGFTFRRNTLHTGGNSEGFRSGRATLIELNHIYNMGLMQHDGSAINVGLNRQVGTVIRYNWSHDHNRGGIRFDAVSSSDRYGTDGTIHNNVVWKSHRIAVKGDRHLVMNNTSFDNSTYDIGILDHTPMGGFNKETVTRNNLAGTMSGKFWLDYPVPGIFDHNWIGDVRSVLCDPDNLDFRPAEGAEIIDSGIASDRLEMIVWGDSPDIGAYEAGATHYWIPGRQTSKASTPIPPDHAAKVKPTADLMWLGAYRASSHEVYFGEDRGRIENATRDSDLFRGSYQTNIFVPGNLESGKTYYWRVDAVKDQGTIRGDTWRFTVEEITK